MRRAISRALELEGFEVELAEDGIEALTVFDEDAAEWPDLVVLDILMPNLDGLTACRAIRGKSRVPILMLDGASSGRGAGRGLGGGR